MNYYKRAEDLKPWWCNTHNREATHLIMSDYDYPKFTKHCCDPKLGGIMLLCECTMNKNVKTATKDIMNRYDSGDAWAEIELYRWEHGELPGANSPALDIPKGLLGMAKAIEDGVTSGDMTPKNFPTSQSVVEVLRYIARHLKQ